MHILRIRIAGFLFATFLIVVLSTAMTHFSPCLDSPLDATHATSVHHINGSGCMADTVQLPSIALSLPAFSGAVHLWHRASLGGWPGIAIAQGKQSLLGIWRL